MVRLSRPIAASEAVGYLTLLDAYLWRRRKETINIGWSSVGDVWRTVLRVGSMHVSHGSHRAARSHSASVGSLPPTHEANAFAWSTVTHTTGCSPRSGCPHVS